jgi:hypothetical protein
VTVRDVISRLAGFSADETIYAESATPTARALVALQPDDGGTPEPRP